MFTEYPFFYSPVTFWTGSDALPLRYHPEWICVGVHIVIYTMKIWKFNGKVQTIRRVEHISREYIIIIYWEMAKP